MERNGGGDAGGPAAESNGGGSGGRKRPLMIGVAGGTSSGKSPVCEKIMARLGSEGQRRVVHLTQEDFYKELRPEERSEAERGRFNFDHPAAFDDERMVETLSALRAGRSVRVPVYDMESHSRRSERLVECGEVVLAEGILLFYNPAVRALLDMRVFVDTDSDIRLARRVERDVAMGRDLTTVLAQYKDLVKPAYEEFCLPTKKYAHITIPRGAENEPAINLMVQHIQEQLRSPRSSPVSQPSPLLPQANAASQAQPSPPRPSRPH